MFFFLVGELGADCGYSVKEAIAFVKPYKPDAFLAVGMFPLSPQQSNLTE
jgi:hypothetical protein